MVENNFVLTEELLSATPIAIDNGTFLNAIFGGIEPNGKTKPRPIVSSFLASPKTVSRQGWVGWAWDGKNEPTRAEQNSYFTVSAVLPNADGKYYRRNEQFFAQYVVVLDDVVPKVIDGKTKAQIPFNSIHLKPSYMLETSKNNYQVGFILKVPITELEKAEAINKAIIKKGLCDSGAHSPGTRYMRLPYASNTKYGHAFRCQLRWWEPENKYTLAELVDGLGLDLVVKEKSAQANKEGATVHSHGNSILIPRPSTNIVLQKLSERGLLKHESGAGKYEITCPWVGEHTNQIDSGACYWEPGDENPIGSFKCQHAHCQDRNIRDLLKFLEIEPEDAYMKHRIIIRPGEFDRIVNASEQVLSYTGMYYQHDDRIVMLDENGADRGALKQVNVHDLYIELSRLVRWSKEVKKKKYIPTEPLQKYFTTLAEKHGHPLLGEIKGVSNQPIIREDGSLFAGNGYDSLTGIYCKCDKAFPIKEKPTKDDAICALDELKGLLSEFPFGNKGVDESASLCAMLTATVRSQLALAPMFLIRAHESGTGKGYLSNLVSLFACQKEPSPISFPSNATEFEKVFLSELIRAPYAVIFDNLTGDLKAHTFLCSALTSETLSGRVLGETRMAKVGTRTLLIANGNNISPVGDMTRRTLVIDLDAKEENPAKRKFKNPNLLEQVRANREYYVSLAMTIILAWIQAKEPIKEFQPIATYTQWEEWCRKPLLWLDLPDPVSKMFDSMDNDPEKARIGQVFEALKEFFGKDPITTKDIGEKISVYTEESSLIDALSEIGCYVNGLDKLRLGWWLKRNEGRTVSGIRLNKVGQDSHTKQPIYRLAFEDTHKE